MKSDEAGSGDCRHDCDDEESHQEYLSKVTTSMMTTMTNALHWDLETGWSSSPFSTVLLVCIQGVLWSLRCCFT